MALYTIESASIRHVKPLAKTMRPQTCAVMSLFGLEPRSALHRAFRGSSYARTALIEGRPVAMWGVHNTALSESGTVWAAIGEEATRWKLAIVRRAHLELCTMAIQAGELYAGIIKTDPQAIAFAKALGFIPMESDDRMVLMTFGRA